MKLDNPLSSLVAVALMSAAKVAGQQWPPEGVAVLEPSDPGFEDATARWNGYGAPSFGQAVVPTSADEVAEIVKSAGGSNISFLAMGGRHGYGTTFAQLQDGLAIDLSQLNTVNVDASSGTVTVGASAKISDVINPVAEAGFQIGSGACNCAGYTGTALGAGIGYLQGIFGLVADSLVSADVVTAEGKQIKVSSSSNPELFWALRGAGANFGIVTSATYKMSKPVNGGQVYHAELGYSAAQQAEYFKTMEAFQKSMPAELGFSSALAWDPPAGSATILATFIYIGSEKDAQAVLKPFLDLEPLILVSETIPFQEVPSVVLTGITDASCNTVNGLHSIHTVNVRKWPADTFSSVFEQFDKFLQENKGAREANSAIIIETFATDAATAIDDGETAYPWRDAAGYIMLQMRWPGLDNPFGEVANKFARGLRDEIASASGYNDLSAYVNYAWGDETPRQIYRADKLKQLIALKSEWDPKNLFRFANGLTETHR